jgi:hypothetical protein
MGIEEIRIPPLNINDPSVIQKALSNVNPQAILSEFGFDVKETAAILEGDYSPVSKKMLSKLRALDYNKIMANYCKDLSPELCHLFFTKAKEQIQFTEEEIQLFKETYEKFFTRCYDAGSAYIYRFEEVPESRNLLIRVDEEFYQLSILDDQAVITYLPDYKA